MSTELCSRTVPRRLIVVVFSFYSGNSRFIRCPCAPSRALCLAAISVSTSETISPFVILSDEKGLSNSLQYQNPPCASVHSSRRGTRPVHPKPRKVPENHPPLPNTPKTSVVSLRPWVVSPKDTLPDGPHTVRTASMGVWTMEHLGPRSGVPRRPRLLPVAPATVLGPVLRPSERLSLPLRPVHSPADRPPLHAPTETGRGQAGDGTGTPPYRVRRLRSRPGAPRRHP